MSKSHLGTLILMLYNANYLSYYLVLYCEISSVEGHMQIVIQRRTPLAFFVYEIGEYY